MTTWKTTRNAVESAGLTLSSSSNQIQSSQFGKAVSICDANLETQLFQAVFDEFPSPQNRSLAAEH